MPETRYEYIRIERKKLPPDSIAAHNLEPLFYNDAVYFQIRKCMYGLPQAGRLSQLRLKPFDGIFSVSLQRLIRLSQSTIGRPSFPKLN